MKALLLASAALLVGLPAQADSVWLIMREWYNGGYGALNYIKIPAKDLDSCEEQGALFVSSERLIGGGMEKFAQRGFECLEGK